MENVVAVKEDDLRKQIGSLSDLVRGVEVSDNESFAKAGELAKRVKGYQKQVTEYWEPIRQSTYAAYKAVMDKKAQMLEPLTDAEKVLKKKLGDYTMELERQRREEEERLRRIAEEEQRKRMEEARRLEEESRKKEQEAKEAEASGDFFAELAKAEAEAAKASAEAAVAEAKMYTGASVSVQVEKPQSKGVSQRVAWEIVSVDESKVPIGIAGVVIRPVDQAAVMRLIKASNGTVEIPGVEYRKTVNMVIRG